MLLVRLAALLVTLLMAAPALAQPITLTGTITYRERIALPTGARLDVHLVRLPDADPVVGAAARIPAHGQVPIAFTLNVHSPLAQGAYGLVATIGRGDEHLFRTAQPVPVDLSATAPIDILVHYAPTPRVSVVDEAPEPANTLVDLVWTVTSIGGRPVTGGRPITLSIAADHRAGGNGGCNNYFSEATLDGAKLAFDPAAASKMACEPTIMDQETAYFAALAAVSSYEQDGDSLRLLDAAGIPLIGLVRATE